MPRRSPYGERTWRLSGADEERWLAGCALAGRDPARELRRVMRDAILQLARELTLSWEENASYTRASWRSC